jgi:hypothetical protein
LAWFSGPRAARPGDQEDAATTFRGPGRAALAPERPPSPGARSWPGSAYPDLSTASLIENGKRPPNDRVATACDEVFPERKDWFTEWLLDIRAAPEIPATFRNWRDYEDKSTTLRAWTPSIIDGLAQTEDYARALSHPVPQFRPAQSR